MSVLITGAAGFIGYHTATRLLEEGKTVTGYDSLTPYYDPQLKQDRLARLREYPAFSFYQNDLTEADALDVMSRDVVSATRP